MKSLRIKIGKKSRGHFRMGSYLSVIALVGAATVGRVAEWVGTPDARWVDVVEWICITIIVGDIFHALSKLSPRKRWERVMGFGFIAGGALLLSALILWLQSGDEEMLGKLIVVGGFTLLVSGLGGWWLWRRACRELNSRILERKLNHKKRKYE